MSLHNRNIIRRLICATLVGGSLLSALTSADAALSLDYTIDSSNPAATVYYNPSQDPDLHGSSIAVTQVTGINTNQNAGSAAALAISSGTLNFVSGALSGVTTVSGESTWSFNGGGSISVNGGIASLSLGSGSTLLSGTFASATVTQLSSKQFQFNILGASLQGTENPSIFSYFDIPAGSASNQAMNLSFIAGGTANNGFASTQLFSGSIDDVPTPTPIPAAAWLLGSGVLGLVGLRRKKTADLNFT